MYYTYFLKKKKKEGKIEDKKLALFNFVIRADVTVNHSALKQC